MLKEKSSKWLKKALKQYNRMLDAVRIRHFWLEDETFEISLKKADGKKPTKYELVQVILNILLYEEKIMQEELDSRTNRV